MMRILLIISVTLVTVSMNFSLAFQSGYTYGNETDRLALLEFKSKITYYYNPHGALDSWNDSSDHCSWKGIKCNREHPRRVTVLDLRSWGSFGVSIPPDIGNLTFLLTLRLSYNSFNGVIPVEIGRLFRLQYLDLSYNLLSGEIPKFLKNCPDLKALDLSGNSLKGKIPPSLKSLMGIQVLILGHNHMSGQIPGYLESFLSLKKLDLSWNNFEGQVPKQGIFNNTSAFSYDGNSGLCGGNPSLQLPSCQGIISENLRMLLILCGVVFSVTIILGSIIMFLWRRKSRNKPSSSESPVSDMFHKVSYKRLLRATDGFSSINLVGVGGYSTVYAGILMLSHEIPTVVAVKVLDLQKRGALNSFKAECEASRCIRHRNIMKVLTSCSSVDFKGNEFKALVNKFMPNGSLEKWLYPMENHGQNQRSANRPLKFIKRLNIAIDVASALDYLHRQCQTPIAHCDLKPSNVLLDEDLNGHLGDFGSAKFLHGVTVDDEPGYRCSTSFGIGGSIGYVAPEYGMGRAVTINGDFYSFGIMLLELFTGRRPTSNMFKDGLSLHSFAKSALATDKIMQIVDPTLVILQNEDDNYDKVIINGEKNSKLCEAYTDIIKLGVTCSAESPKQRMEMELVVERLQFIKNVYLF